MGSMPNAAPLSTLAWLGWLAVAVMAHFMIALFGVLSRYLQVKAYPPVPSLRLLLLVSILGMSTMLLLYTTPLFIARWLNKRWDRQQQFAQPQAVQAVQAHAGPEEGPAERPAEQQESSDKSAPDLETGGDSSVREPADLPGEGQEEGGASQPPSERPPPPKQLRARVQQPKSSVRPDVPLSRGISARFERLEARRPQLIRGLALGGLTACGICAGALQIGALRFVDASIVQLIQMFTVIAIAVFQAGLLHHRIPWVLWPTAAVMLAGAAMVIVPTIQRGGTGGLGSAKSYLGVGMAVGYLACMATYFILLQASRHMGFSSVRIQYCFMVASIIVLLPISLPIDGVDWAADMAPWDAHDWLVLAVLGTVVCIGAGVLIQHAIWKLSAPTVSLFYGLRLVFTVVQSKIILHTTIIQTPLQISGIVVTATAVTSYMGWQWWCVRQQQAAAGETSPKGSLKLEEDAKEEEEAVL